MDSLCDFLQDNRVGSNLLPSPRDLRVVCGKVGRGAFLATVAAIVICEALQFLQKEWVGRRVTEAKSQHRSTLLSLTTIPVQLPQYQAVIIQSNLT